MLIKNISEQAIELLDLAIVSMPPDASIDLYELLHGDEATILNSAMLGTAIDAGLIQATDRFGFTVASSADLQKPARLLPKTKQIELAKLSLLHKSASPFSLIQLSIANVAQCEFMLFEYAEGSLQNVTNQMHWPNGGSVYAYAWPSTTEHCPCKINMQYTIAVK